MRAPRPPRALDVRDSNIVASHVGRSNIGPEGLDMESLALVVNLIRAGVRNLEPREGYDYMPEGDRADTVVDKLFFALDVHEGVVDGVLSRAAGKRVPKGTVTEKCAAFKGELARILKRHEEELDAFAARVREALVVPVCKRHKLQFLTGNGSFDFNKGTYGTSGYRTYAGSEDDLRGFPKAARETLEAVFALLNVEVAYDDYLGYRVEQCDARDNKEGD